MICAILRPQLNILPYLLGDILADIPAAVLVSRLAMAIVIIEDGNRHEKTNRVPIDSRNGSPTPRWPARVR